MSEDGDKKPIVTYHGDHELFSAICVELLNTLPREPVEWRRSYSRAPKFIRLDVTFQPFSVEQLARENERTLFRKPCLHIYMTDCADADAYKLVVKDEIATWQQTLKERNIPDWLIVLVETTNPKRGNKTKLLPRTSVLDKIKNDFCSKQADRVIVLNEPNNPVPTNRSLESWQVFIQRLRYLLLGAYSRLLNRFEEFVRAERERRTEKGWEFCRYFLLQEELAFAFQLLQLPEEALVQYDELDALFSQFIINTHAGDNPSWLSTIAAPCVCWDGLSLSPTVIATKRIALEKGQVALLDLRNYLFARQCALILFVLKRPWEVALRAQSFLHNCVQELKMLEVSMPTGSMACWVFLSCQEVLLSCSKYTDSSNVEIYSHYTASLWVYAQTKLRELGELCGLFPDATSNSDQLQLVVGLLSGMGQSHEALRELGELCGLFPDATSDSDQLQLVVGLLSGMGQSHEASISENSPNQKLREALSSSEAFQKHYLELSELAMGTFKHIKRMRSARLIGKDLATFYMKKKEWTKAETFLIDAVRIYEKEGWSLLVTGTRREIAQCQKQLGNKHKYLKTCCLLAADSSVDAQERQDYFKEILALAEDLNDEPGRSSDSEQSLKAALVPFYSVAHLNDVELQPKEGKLGKNEEGLIILHIHSKFPDSISTNKISLFLHHENQESDDQSNQLTFPKSQSQSSFKSLSPTMDQWGPVTDSYLRSFLTGNQQMITTDLEQEFRYKTENGTKYIDSAIIICKNITTVLRREDSSSSLGKSLEILQKEEWSHRLELDNVELKPGENVLSFKFKVPDNGIYSIKQLLVKFGGIEFLLPSVQPVVAIEVSSPDPRLTVTPTNGSILLAGIPQEVTMTISTGYFAIHPNDTLSIQTLGRLHALPSDEVDGYSVKLEEGGATVTLPDIPTFQTKELGMKVMTSLIDVGMESEDSEEEELTEQKMTIWCPWSETVIATLTFQQPFHIKHRLHTAGNRKLVQISIENICSMQFMLTSPQLQVTSSGPIQLKDVNNQNGNSKLCAGQTMSYVWFLHGDKVVDEAALRFELTYTAVGETDQETNDKTEEGKPQQLSHTFTLRDYQTKYMVNSTVTPPSSDEFCRAGTLCNLQLHIKSVIEGHRPITDQNDLSLMYHVMADKHMWAVCGRSQGVVTMATDKEGVDVSLEVMPLLAGFLPVPKVKLSKYIMGSEEITSESQPITQVVLNPPSEGSNIPDTSTNEVDSPTALNTNGQSEPVVQDRSAPAASLVQFAAGQIYYRSLATQVRVLPESDIAVVDVAVQ